MVKSITTYLKCEVCGHVMKYENALTYVYMQRHCDKEQSTFASYHKWVK
jgi:hypothetical protein